MSMTLILITVLIMTTAYSDDIYVECKFHDKFKKWHPLQYTTKPINSINDL